MTEKDKTSEITVKKNGEWTKYMKVGVTAFVTVAACILFFFFMYRFEVIAEEWGKLVKSAEPIIIGLVLAYLLMPVKNRIEEWVYKFLAPRMKKEEKAKAWSQTISIVGCILFLLVIIGILLAILIPAVVSSVTGLIENLSNYLDSFLAWVNESGIGKVVLGSVVGDEITEFTTELMEWAKKEIWPQIQSYIVGFQGYIIQITSGVVSVLKTLMNFIIGIIVMVYVMSIQTKLIGQSKKIIYAIFPVKKANVIIETVRKSNEIFGGFIIVKIIDSAIIGVICYIGCLVLQMPSGLLVAVIVGVTNVVPFFGPFLGAFISIPLVLIQSPIHAIYLAIFILLLQQVDGNIIGPKILGDTTGLSSFWVMFSILVAGGLFGFAGMLLGVPTFAVIYYIIQRLIRSRMEKRKLPSTTEEYVELISIDEKTMELKYSSKQEEEK